MDFNSSNKNTGKRKAQTIQEMINSTPQSGTGIRKSGYSGPKNINSAVSSHTSDLSGLSGINVNRSNDYDRWGNSNEGMPKPKKQRYKADVANPMRGNILKHDLEQSKERLERKARDIEREKRSQRRADYDDFDNTGALPRADRYTAPEYKGALDSYGWIIYIATLAFCVMVVLIASGVKPRGSGYKYPMNVVTISGVVNSAYEDVMGINGTFGVISGMGSSYAGTSTVDEPELAGNTKVVDIPSADNLTDLGDEGEAATLDDGTMEIPGMTQAASHSELVSQIQSALSSGNYAFVSTKIAYEDEQSGALDAYPMSQVKHFCEYMSANPDKISSFINSVSSEEYSAKNGNSYILKLPIMKFTVKMGTSSDSFVLDNTVVSVSGFSDVIVNGNQNAAIYPLLPCMYTVTLTNNAWSPTSQSQEIEATLGEGNLEIKVGQASE